MKIASAKVIPITMPIQATIEYTQGRIPFFQRLILELTTTDGIVGYGECRGDALRHTAMASLGKLLAGHDPYHLERFRWMIAPQGLVDLFQGSVAAHVNAAVEMACLDIVGQATGRSVSDLLGGRMRDEIPMAGYLYYTAESRTGSAVASPQSMLEAAHALSERYGFRTWKYKGGVKDPMEEVATAALLRRDFPHHQIRMDPNGSWGISTSVRVLQAVREIGLEFIEDPVPSFPKLARIHAMNLGTPLASNQAIASLETIALNEALRAVDIPLLDVNWYGGLRACLSGARMAELLGLDIGVHSSMECAVSQAAQLHLAACAANLVYASDTHYIYLEDDIRAGGKLPIRDGAMAVPQGPGLGVTIDQDKLRHYHALWQETGFFNWGSDASFPVTLPRW